MSNKVTIYSLSHGQKSYEDIENLYEAGEITEDEMNNLLYQLERKEARMAPRYKEFKRLSREDSDDE